MSSESETQGWVQEAALGLVDLNDLDEIEALLIAKGCPAKLTNKLLLLIPSAFAAEYFEPQGIEFPKQFFVGEPGEFGERQYAEEPIYGQARLLARKWLAESRPSLVARILDWSSEASGIEEARAQGKTPTKVSTVHHGF